MEMPSLIYSESAQLAAKAGNVLGRSRQYFYNGML